MNQEFASQRVAFRIPGLLRSLSYNRVLRRIVRRLNLQNLLRKVYYRFALSPNHVFSLQMAGFEARFLPQTPGELRLLDHGARTRGEKDVLEQLVMLASRGDCIYDVGANVGLYAVFLAKAVGPEGRVIAFEPSSESFKHLLENLALNQATNVQAYCCALGDRRGTGKLYFGDENAESSLAGLPGNRNIGSEDVEVVEGDRWAEEKCLPPPRIVKVDVEGYEYAVLRGLNRTLTNPSCEIVDCEIHPALHPQGIGPSDVLQLLRSYGFERLDLYSCDPVLHAVARKP